MTGAGQIAARVMQFARTLRAAGLPIGPDRVLDAVGAAAEVGLARREDFFCALHAALVSRAEDRALFREAFELFWRAPEDAPDGSDLLFSRPDAPPMEVSPPSRRLADALRGLRTPALVTPGRREEVDAILAWSDREALRTRDFEQMTAAEVAEAEKAIARMRLPVREVPSRRSRPGLRGDRVDVRATLRAVVRAGPDLVPLRFRERCTRPPRVVALCDVSGSMIRYARMLLRFVHALASDRPHVHVFTFATRLTDVTRSLVHRDVDVALASVGRAVKDWEGGTRIGDSLREFNVRWSRRLLGQGAVVLLFTDGLDCGDGLVLVTETERLRRSSRRLVWLNPLLRYQGFEPLAAGVRSMLPHVDEFRPVHDLESLAALARALSDEGTPSRRGSPADRFARSLRKQGGEDQAESIVRS